MKNMHWMIFFLITFLSSFSTAPMQPETYRQKVKTDIALPVEAGVNVLQLLKKNDCIYVVTDAGIFKKEGGGWTTISNQSGWSTVCQDVAGNVWVASDERLIDEYGNNIVFPDEMVADTILSVCWEDINTIHVGTTNGAWTYKQAWQAVVPSIGKKINAIVKDYNSDLWMATNDGLLQRKNGHWINLDDFIMTDANERSYFCLAAQNKGIDMIYSSPHSIGCIAANGNHWVNTGVHGLPYGPVTTIRAIGETLWLGTKKGAIKRGQNWQYYHGRRWLPDNHINDILPIDEHTVWLATPKGISQIQEIEMTLEQKADHFEERIHERHVRHGLVSRSNISIPGDLSTCMPAITHNEGLWTSIYLVAECFRFAATNNIEAKKNAESAFEAMERLESVTGVPGFPARTLAAYDEKITTRGEWHISQDGHWKWIGDTSSDEMVGHFFAYPIFYELVADKKYKRRVEKLVTRILDHIVGNDFQLIDLDGKPTRWGVWNPDSLNSSVGWANERGLNSLQILAFLKSGYYITKDKKFEEACQGLIQNHHYAENMVQQKMYGPFEMNFVDNQLSFLPYYIIARYSDDERLWPYINKSIERTWKIVRNDQIAMWNIISSVTLEKDCDLDVAIDGLRSIPMDMVDWTMENSHRWDLQKDFLADRRGKNQAARPIPLAERGITKWNLNVYQFNLGRDGKNENDGAYFLLGYWMGRYHGFFK